MKIKRIHFYTRALGLTRPYSIAYKTVTEVKNVFFEIHLENGIIGMGSANPSPQVVGESVDDVMVHLRQADFTFLENRSIHEFESIVKDCYYHFHQWPGSLAAIDIALYDAFTQYLKVPLHRYFGLEHKSLSTSITIGIKNLEETLEEADEYYSRGFKSIKVKTGKDPATDAERVIKIHEKYPTLKIRVDANQGYRPEDLEEFINQAKDIPLELVEQPFPVKDFANYSGTLKENLSGFLVADESLKSANDAIYLLKEASQCKIFNIKLMKSGGLREAGKIADIAENSGVDLMWGCNDESRISITAALNIALCSKRTKYIDLDGSLDLSEDVVDGGFLLKEGEMYLPDAPGLGVKYI